MTTDTKQEILMLPQEGFLRLPDVLRFIPVGKSTFWAGIKTGRFPAAVKLGPRTTAWRVSDIRKYIDTFNAG
ncbi:helix-turn-helix transcriptional regulator [Taibaiella koreensis]|uniref:helix-turn-helix transcriptional regulator n=1 Tax=Taibaiella koreensis TaxID=1268548 RepID=UPI00196956A4|nr:AlpA family phage regulatory protein [Taibaiella koreensis]